MSEFSHENPNQQPEVVTNPYQVLLDEEQGAVLTALDEYVDKGAYQLVAGESVGYEHTRRWQVGDSRLKVTHQLGENDGKTVIKPDITTVSRTGDDGSYDYVRFTKDPSFGWIGEVVRSTDLKNDQGPRVSDSHWNDGDNQVSWSYDARKSSSLKASDLIAIVNDDTAPTDLRQSAHDAAENYTHHKIDDLISLLDGTYKPVRRATRATQHLVQTAMRGAHITRH